MFMTGVLAGLGTALTLYALHTADATLFLLATLGVAASLVAAAARPRDRRRAVD